MKDTVDHATQAPGAWVVNNLAFDTATLSDAGMNSKSKSRRQPCVRALRAAGGGDSFTGTDGMAQRQRERPHLMLNADGDPIYLTGGVAPWAPGTPGRWRFGDWTYTTVFPICLEQVVKKSVSRSMKDENKPK